MSGREEEVIQDPHGRLLAVGASVRYYDDEAQTVGHITRITECEGDVDDETRQPIMYYPKVIVAYPDGEEQDYSTFLEHEDLAAGPDGEPVLERVVFECEELYLVDTTEEVV